MNHAPVCITLEITSGSSSSATVEASYIPPETVEETDNPTKPSFLRRLWSRLTCRCEGVGLDKVCPRCCRPGDMGMM